MFEDYVKPYFAEHPLDTYREADVFSYNGVRFRVMASDPPGVSGRRGTERAFSCCKCMYRMFDMALNDNQVKIY